MREAMEGGRGETIERRLLPFSQGERSDTILWRHCGATMSQRPTGSFYNRSLERALQILDAFSRERMVLTRTQLAEMLDLPRPTVSRLCSTLVRYGYLAEDPESRRYSLGIRLFEQGSIVFYSFSVRAAASRYLTLLQKEINQTVFLGVLDNDQLLYIDKREDADKAITFTSKIGTRRPPYWGMCGPMLMAHLSDGEVERLLKKTPLSPITKQTITDKEKFKAWLHEVREQGFAVDAQATFDGITGIAAPVRDFRGEVVASVGAALISSTIDRDDIQRIARALMEDGRGHIEGAWM